MCVDGSMSKVTNIINSTKLKYTQLTNILSTCFNW